MSTTNIQQQPFDYQDTGTHNGMTYLILQHPGTGHLCGYVLIPEGHPLYATTVKGDYDTPSVSVHGGLTFAGKLPDREGIWLGFDCAHCGDLVPNMVGRELTMPGDTFKDQTFVFDELVELILQLNQVTE